MLRVESSKTGAISFHGRLDASQTDIADKALAAITTAQTIDLQELDYISSAGLGILLKHQKRLQEQGKGLKLINLNKYVKDVFMYTGFDQIFEVG
jgi:anti-sigma B factor antagonist